jgi:hypothetical protein
VTPMWHLRRGWRFRSSSRSCHGHLSVGMPVADRAFGNRCSRGKWAISPPHRMV